MKGFWSAENKPICHNLKFVECQSAEICHKSFRKMKIFFFGVLCEDENRSSKIFKIQH